MNTSFDRSMDATVDLLKSGAIQTPTPRPLVNRCRCGRHISYNRAACAACAKAELHATVQAIAKNIRTTPEMEAFLQQFEPEERAEVEALVKPAMLARFEKEEEPVCGK